jgi:hypothetical protein
MFYLSLFLYNLDNLELNLDQLNTDVYELTSQLLSICRTLFYKTNLAQMRTQFMSKLRLYTSKCPLDALYIVAPNVVTHF